MKIYLDNNATTPLDPLVIEAVLQELSAAPGNPSSIHSFGKGAKRRLQGYRENIARFLSVQPHEILFTSGGTESMNLLIRGLFEKGHIISSNIEHSCIYNTLLSLQKRGASLSLLPAGLLGAVLPEQVEAAIQPDTALIVLCAVNSETGVKHDIPKMGALALKYNIPLVVDGVAWLGKELFSIPPGVTGMGFSGHKLHAPKGVGCVYLKAASKLSPFITGANQEYGLRSGTENLPGIAGLAKAIDLLPSYLPEATRRMELLRDQLETGLRNQINPVIVNGAGQRICNVSNLSFPQDLGEDLLVALDQEGIAVSHGSACASGALEPSRVLTQMGVPFSVARSALRFSLSRYTKPDDIDVAIATTARIVKRLK
jgi:cysteine desulfurase